MRHYDAVQLADGTWKYCHVGSKGAYPVGNCSPDALCPDCGKTRWVGPADGVPPCQTCGDRGLVPRPDPCPGHATKQEAYDHQAAYDLDHARYLPETPEARDRASQLHRCEAALPDGAKCGAWTCGAAQVDAYQYHFLCPAHCNPAGLAALIRVGARWQS